MSESDPLSVPLSVCPDPVLGYRIRDREPVVTAVNEVAEAAFDVPEGTPVADLFASFDVVESTGEASPVERLRDGDPGELYLGSFTDGPGYVARVLPDDGGDAGYLLFTEVDTIRALTDRVGVAEVASAVSHDLRNPLDVAEAHLYAAREDGDTEHFDAVADAHDRMETIIQDVLTLARGDAVLDPSPNVSIRAAAADAWNSVDTEAADLRLAESLPTATADAERVQRLFENLFRNCLEHGSTGPESETRDGVTVTVDSLDDDGVFVADDGPGVDESEREAVFSPGYTVDGGGTGLGLAIVRRIAEAHGWGVRLTESERGGARVEIRFDP
jgi:signal transduction histidine kinase